MRKIFSLLIFVLFLVQNGIGQTINFQKGEKVFPIYELTHTDKDKHMSMADGSMCGYTYSYNNGAIFANQDVNISLINDLFHTTYNSYESLKNNIGMINTEIFNEYSCVTETENCVSAGDKYHRGIDYSITNQTTSIYSPFKSDGKVIRAENVGSIGGYLAVYYQEFDITVFYLHVYKIIAQSGTIKYGQEVALGAKPTAPNANHLHLEVRTGSKLSACCANVTVSNLNDNIDPRAFYAVTNLNYGLINSGVEIYAGEKNNPRTNVKITIDASNLPSGQNFTVHDFAIGNASYSIQTANYNNNGTTASFEIVKFPSVPTNKLYDFSFKVRDKNGNDMKFYGENQIYYIDENAVADINNNSWYSYYVKKGIKNGLFKGSYNTIFTNAYSFNPDETLSRAQFAKMAVCAAINLGLMEIDIRTTTGTFNDITEDNIQYFPYIQTLRQYGCIDRIDKFRPDNSISVGEMCKMLTNAFNIQPSDNNISSLKTKSIINSRIVVSNDAGDLKPYIELLKSIIDYNESINNPGMSYYEPLITNLFVIPDSRYSDNSTIIVDGKNFIKRAHMAKAIWNSYQYAARKRGIQLRAASPNNLSNITIIGDKFEATSNVTGSEMAPGKLDNIVLRPGQSIVIDKFQNITGDIFFYWSVNGGTLEDLSPNNAHNMVKFTAPDNITSTEIYDLYMYAGNSQGRYMEAFGKITVEVNNAITHLDPPTGLYVGDIGQNYFKVYWDNADWNRVTKYIIQSATNSSFTQNLQEDIKTGGEANRIVGRTAGTYYIRIKAVNTALNLESAWSNTIQYTFAPNIPFDIWNDRCTPADGAVLNGNNVTFTWYATGSNNPTFDLYFSKWNPFGQTPVISNTMATTYTINNLNWNTTYYWGVKGRDAAGMEDQTNVMSFTTTPSTTLPTGSITINYGETTTNNLLVNLQISAQTTNGNIDQMQLSNDGSNWTDWRYYTTNMIWHLDEYGGTNSPGLKTVYVRFKDNSKNISAIYTDNITLKNTAPGYFYVRDLKTASLRAAIEYAQAGDNIYATSGYFDLSDEINGGMLGTTTVSCGANLKNGVNLIGEGMDKTTLYWAVTPQVGYSYSYYGLILEGNNVVEGITLITPATYATTSPESSPNGQGKAITSRSSDCVINNCIIKNSFGAMEVRNASNLTIQNCLIHDNGFPRAIDIYDCSNVKFYNNSIYNNSSSVLDINLGNNIQVKNNIVANNLGQAIYINAENTSNLSFTNNNVWGNHYANQADRNYDDQSFSLHDQTGINGNISVNPQFDSMYHLLTGSPCINTGVNVGLPYSGTAPDMGAYETNLPTGSLTIQSNTTANFVISKPDGSSISITAGQTLSNLEQGFYGIYPQEIYGYYTPRPTIQKITQGTNIIQLNYTADTQAPEAKLYLNAGDFFTHSRYISIYNDVVDEVNGLSEGALMQFSNDGTIWSPQEPLSNKKLLWDLASYGGNLTAGEKTIYAKFCDAKGNWSKAITETIEFIPEGRIIVVTPETVINYTNRTDGDILLLTKGQHYFSQLGGSSVRQKMKFQGIAKDAKLYGGTLYEPIKFDNITLENINLYSTKSSFTNIVMPTGYLPITSNTNVLIANSIFTGESNNGGLINLGTSNATLDCYNNVIKGKGDENLAQSYLSGMRILANENNKLIRVKNNILFDFSSASYSGAIVVQRNNINFGNVEISNNNFYNNRIDLESVRLLIENIQPYHIVPDLINDDSYKLQTNSVLRNLGSDNIIHRNHDGSKNTLGIEGGLFYNTVPVANATATSKNMQVSLDASGSSDEQTPTGYLQYRWDYNNDGVFDTNFLLSPLHTASAELLGDTIVAWVFDEHFSMNYVKIAKADIKILPDDAQLSAIVTGNTYCAGSELNLTTTIVGEFDNDNLFTVELSDAFGNFTNATILDNIYGNSIEKAQLSINLPGNLVQGSYKIRLSSSEPPIKGQASEAFTINASRIPEVTISANKQEICEGTNVIFGANIQNANGEKSYKWYINDQLVGANSPAFSTNTLQNGDVIKMELTCISGCYFPSVVVSNEISMIVNSLQTPYVEIITSYYDNPQKGDPIDLFAYVENGGDNLTYKWYVNNIINGGNDPFITVNYAPNTTISVKVQCNSDCLKNDYVETSYTFLGLGENTNIESNPVKHFSIYPNPIKDYVFIQTELSIEKVEIYSLTGTLLIIENNFNGKISISHLPKGVYLLKVYCGKGVVISKIVKE